jgi:hypothetical protein
MKLFPTLTLVAGIAALTVIQPSFADDAKPDAVKKESSKADAAKADTDKADTANTDTAKTDTAKTDTAKTDTAKTDVNEQSTHTFLGVYVTPAHPALAHNLSEHLSPEQGLIIEDFVDGSPAEKAGLKVHDILTSYDDQKLFSAEQLGKLVHSDKAGREVKISYLRGGKMQKAEVKLGQTSPEQLHAWGQSGDAPEQGNHGPHHMVKHQNDSAANSDWETFDSLTLKKLSDKKFHAEVQYLDKDGKSQKHTFEGTREEIKKAIDGEKDLKPSERTHLLRSLNLPDVGDGFQWFPEWLEFGPEGN